MADGSFRIAGAFVEVNLKDNTAADEAKLRTRLEGAGPISFETALKDPDNLTAVRERIKATGPIHLDVKADADLASAVAAGVQMAEFTNAAADGTRRRMEQAGKESGSSFSKGFGTAASANANLTALQWVGAFAGLPAAAAAGAAGVSAALIGVPALFVGIGAAALKGNEQVAAAFSTTKTQVVDGTQQMAAVLAGPLAAAAGDLGASFTRLRPQIQTAMTGSVPAVHTLTGAVTDFAESAMPGMVTAVKSSDAPLQGLRSLAGQAGTGLTEMLTNLSAGSRSAGTSLGTLGGVVRDAEGWAGSLLAVLANGSTGTLPQFRATLGQLEGTVLSIATAGMPALQGASSGFLGTIGGGLGILSAAAGALGSWTAPLGQLGGSLFATNSVAKLFGTSLGETSFGLKAFASSVDEAGNKTSPFRTALANTEAGGSKLSRGLSSIVSSGVNPLGIALVGGGLLLDAFGQAQQKASEAAAAHRENVRNLTDAIRQDNGVLGAHTQAVNVDALTAKNAANNVAVFGGTLELAKSAIQGNAGALQVMTQKSNDAITSIGKQAGLSDTQIKGLVGLNEGLLKTGGSYDSLGSKVEGYSTKTVNAGRSGAIATDALTEAQRNQLTAIMNGTGAVGEQVKSQRDAYDAYILSESALTGLTTTQVANRDATVKATQALYDQQNQALGYRGAVLTTQDALTAFDQVSKNHTSTEGQKAQALLAVERAFAAQEQAAYNAAFSNSKATSESQKAAEAFTAQDRETVKLANSVGGTLPQSLQTTISRMSVSQAQAAGLTVELDRTGQAVYRLPDGKTIRIEQQGAQAVQDAVNGLIRDNNGRVINIRVNTVQGYTNVGVGTGGKGSLQAEGGVLKPYASGGIAAYAAGGMPSLTPMQPLAAMVPRNTWRVVGDNMKVPEAYIPIDPASKRSQDLLSETNALMGRGGQGSGPTTVNHNWNITINGAEKSNPEIAAAMGSEISWLMRAR